MSRVLQGAQLFYKQRANLSLVSEGLEQSQSDPVGGVELPLCALSRQGREGLEIIKM